MRKKLRARVWPKRVDLVETAQPNGVNHSMSNSPTRILAVDDVAMNLTLLSELLGAEGFVVDTALTAGEGFALACDNRYALLLFDIQLPDFNGDVLLQRLRAKSDANSSASPALALTGELNTALRIHLLKSGFTDVFAKPWSANAIISAVNKLIGEGSTTRPGVEQGDASDASDALFDRALALKTTGGDVNLMLKLRAMLVAELISKGSALRTAFAQNDDAGLNEQRHKLAGAAAFTGAVALVAALSQLKSDPSEAAIAAVECAISDIIAASNLVAI